MGSPLEALQSLGKRWDNILALQCFLSSLLFPMKMCFPFLLKNLLFDLCSCLNRSSCEYCFLLPVQIHLLHPQLHTSPAGDARPAGSADICISVISVKAYEEEQNLVLWVLRISLACTMGLILSLLQTHPGNPSALTFYSLTTLSGKASQLTSSILLTSQCTFICIGLLLQ